MNPNKQIDTTPLTDDERYDLQDYEQAIKDNVLMDDDVDDPRWETSEDERNFVKQQQYERSTRHDN